MPTDETKESQLTQQERSAMGIRPAIVPVAAYMGSAINNAETIITTLAPWVYLGTIVVLLGITQIIQRRKGRPWDWPFAVVVGFGIAIVAWFVSLGLVNVFAPGQVVSG